MDSRVLIRRWHSPTLFAVIALCFLLPFATVSCSEAETTFTGYQLATWTVPEGGTVGDRDISAQVEDKGSVLAVLILAAAALGLVAGVLRLPRGEGWCAAVGLALTLALLYQLVTSMASATIYEGYTFTLLLFVWAAVLHGARAWRRRRRPHAPDAAEIEPVEASSSHRKSDPYWTAQLARRRPTPRQSGRVRPSPDRADAFAACQGRKES
jgi:hypothetical protein